MLYSKAYHKSTITIAIGEQHKMNIQIEWSAYGVVIGIDTM